MRAAVSAACLATVLPGHLSARGIELAESVAKPQPSPGLGITQAQAPAQAPAAPANTPAPVPTRTEIINFENWAATCRDFAEGPRKRICSAQLVMQQSGTNQAVLTWIVGLNDNKQLTTVIQIPTGVNIPPGLELRLDKAAPRKIPFETCDPGHCTASAPMDGVFVRDLSAASTAEVVAIAENGRSVQFNVPIKGFEKAYAHLRANGS
jgi:invasion protein IalB